MNLFRTKSLEEIRALADLEGQRLKRALGAKDIVALGIGAIIGAGIFSTIGNASQEAGPALVVSFAILGVVCGLAGLCYAELASMIPVSGSAYTYAFATMGELVAWIIGWDLILEYAVGNVAVAISWAGYFNSILEYFHVHLPDWLRLGWGDVVQQMDAARAALANPAKAAHAADNLAELARLEAMRDAAPHVYGHPIMINLPAALIVLAITWVLVRGVRESASFNNGMVLVKFAVLALFLGVGAMYVDPGNWKPFAPHGFEGIAKGASAVFFAYIGFDAVSTVAEETRNPKRDMPIGILGSLAICTVLYMLVGLVATGLVHYSQLDGAQPLADALKNAGHPRTELLVSIGACVAMVAVLLVFQLGQPRIFFSMSRDGLLPKVFARVHPRYQTPHVTTILTGLVVAAGAAFMDDDVTFDLTSIGTLFAFAIACIGVLVLRVTKPDAPRPFRVPAVWLIAPVATLACLATMIPLGKEAWIRFGGWLLIGLLIYFGRAMLLDRRPVT